MFDMDERQAMYCKRKKLSNFRLLLSCTKAVNSSSPSINTIGPLKTFSLFSLLILKTTLTVEVLICKLGAINALATCTLHVYR
jgi:hypothetical protein